ncbi:hypothetical protein Moror_9807 [Moniliophthora roreri MCA 2997]|uniref:RNA-dependent RNA polymerase n=1 Tax=Moniliophthora roreri (strain MCA 2997) TaxID=1381753 RepID=V2X174_MONRO|nr:hypothetical protein Moror_9807 [Moniliophthora roreri MCA 2997]
MLTEPPKTPKFKPSLRPLDASVDSRDVKRRRLDSQVSVVLETENGAKPIIIASDPTLQPLFQKYRTPSAVQYEIARILSAKNKDSDVQSLTEPLFQTYQLMNSSKKPNFDGVAKLHAHVNVMYDGRISEKEYLATAPWSELDLEERVLSRNQLGGVGHTALTPQEIEIFGNDLLPSERATGLYCGGKIDFIGRVEKEGGSYRIRLERASKGPSNKAKRRFGSRNFLKIKIPSGVFKSQNEIDTCFQRPFVMWESVFRAFLGKEDTVLLVRTNETYCGGRFGTDMNRTSMSLYQFINWFNPSKDNDKQVLCKWSSRMALLWSSSVPGPQLLHKDIHFIDDEVSCEGSDMTDGCGFGNLSLFKAIQERFGLEELPCAIQCRVAGSKGMLLWNEDKEDSGSPQVWLRKSQRKVQYPISLAQEPSHRTIDVLRVSRIRSPARLSIEVITNLHHNGVPASVFTNFLKSNLEDAIGPMLAWDLDKDPDAMIKLWHTIEQTENVLLARRARQSVTDIRFRGFHDKEKDEVLDDEDDLDENNGGQQHSTAWWPDPNSHCPSSIAETVMELVAAGFTPQGCLFMRNKIYQLVKGQIKRKCTKQNFDVSMSAGAFAVPDPYGVLEEGQIHFKSSRREFLKPNGLATDILEGPVLITRNPCKVPTDVQKVTAVSHPKLSNIVNVVVFSIKGKRRLIDFLAGGDYDGDRATVFWDPQIVEPFTNADEQFSKEPPDVEAAFTLENSLSVNEFNTKAAESKKTELEIAVDLQHYLLGGLRDPHLIGTYSFIHEKSMYVYGYGHPITVANAYKFCAVMDAPKSGRKLIDRILRRDRSLFPHEKVLPWKKTIDRLSGTTSKEMGTSTIELRRAGDQNPFIMDVLAREAEGLYKSWMTRAESIFDTDKSSDPICKTFLRGADKDLLAPWEFYQAKAVGKPHTFNDLQTIKNHVESVWVEFQEKYDMSFTGKDIVKRQDTLRRLSKAFISSPKPDDLESVMDEGTIARLRASYAYHFLKSNTGKQFPWLMAFDELCLIKAKKSKSGFRAIIMNFADVLKVPRAVIVRT